MDGSLKFVKTIEVFNVQNFQARYFREKFKNDITCPIEISKNSKVLVYATSVLSSSPNHLFGCLEPTTHPK